MGIVSGYPVGAKIVANMKNEHLLSNVEAERLIAFTNNSGPLFIIGTVGITLFGNVTIGFLLLFTHLLACFTVGIIFRFWKYSKPSSLYKVKEKTGFCNNTKKQSSILYDSISNSINTVLLIGGFIVLFSVILSILNNSGVLAFLSNLLQPIFRIFNINPTFCHSFITGIIELTNGISQISSIPCKSISTNIVLCSFLLGFAGICVTLQVYSIISSSNISIKPYILGKLLHGSLAALYTYLIIQNISFFNLDLEPVFANNISLQTNIFYSFLGNSNFFILFIILFLFLLSIGLRKKYKRSLT